jgi:hypothetical protein
MGEFTGFDQLLTTLRQHVRDGASGTLFIRTDANRSAMVGFRRGDIVLLSAGVKSGLDAVPELQGIRAGSHRLTPNTVDMGPSTLPPTRDLLAMLEGAGATAAGSVATAAGSAAPAPPQSAPDGFDAAPATDALRATFMAFIGPIGPMVFQDVLARLGTPRSTGDVEQLVEGLAAELDNASEAGRFRQSARDALARAG